MNISSELYTKVRYAGKATLNYKVVIPEKNEFKLAY